VADILGEAEALAKAMLGGGLAHGYPHVARVRRYAWLIVEAEGLSVDPLVLNLAVLLHDVGRPLGEPHAKLSADFAEAFLTGRLGEERRRRVLNAILYHSYSYSRRAGIRPLGPEALVLSDADKLDALGIVGFTRVFLHGCETGRGVEESLRHFEEKILKLRPLLHYEYSRRLAGELEGRVRAALKWFAEESGLPQP